MIIDARSVEPGRELDADVCVIGCGPAGITIGLELAQTGLRVLVLESGGAEPEPEAQALNAGKSVGYPYQGLEDVRARTIAGSSTTWPLFTSGGDEGWMARPLDPLDFEARPGLEWSGWPFGFDTLAPYYVRAIAYTSQASPSFELTDWERPGMTALPLAEDVVVTRIWHRILSGFTVHRRSLEASSNVSVLTHATVMNLESSGEPATVQRVQVAIDRTRRIAVSARQFVLAAGGIENARLLLLSRGHWASGLGNANDLVGRFFMERLAARIGYITAADPSLLRRTRLYASHRDGTDFVQASLSLSDATIRREGLANATFFVLPRSRDFASEGVRSLRALAANAARRPWAGHTLGHVVNVAKDWRALSRTAVRRVSRTEARDSVLAVRVQAEQSPNRESRLTLGSDRDRLGLPNVVLQWNPSEWDLRSIRRSQELLGAEFERAGLGTMHRLLGDEHPPTVFAGTHHHMGTTRMHPDPNHGVVDPDGRVHGVSNLFVAGSSVFPTAGYANPTFTISALALRLADHLRRARGADIRT